MAGTTPTRSHRARGRRAAHRLPWGWKTRVGGGTGAARPWGRQVFLDTLMVGNFEEKSLAFCAIFTATLRATDM